MTGNIRLFIALELSMKQKEEIALLQEKLKLFNSAVRWVQMKNLHLTLKFLGEIDEALIDEIKSIMNDLVKGIEPFDFSFKDLGFFPSYSSARVIWLGIHKGLENLRELGIALDKELAKIGIAREKRAFQPHLTLGRPRKSLNNEILLNMETLAKGFVTEQSRASGISLFRSELTRKGAVYYLVHESECKMY